MKDSRNSTNLRYLFSYKIFEVMQTNIVTVIMKKKEVISSESYKYTHAGSFMYFHCVNRTCKGWDLILDIFHHVGRILSCLLQGAPYPPPQSCTFALFSQITTSPDVTHTNLLKRKEREKGRRRSIVTLLNEGLTTLIKDNIVSKLLHQYHTIKM